MFLSENGAPDASRMRRGLGRIVLLILYLINLVYVLCNVYRVDVGSLSDRGCMRVRGSWRERDARISVMNGV